MIVVMEPGAPESALEAVIEHLSEAHFDVHRSSGQSRTIFGVVGDVSEDALAVVRDLEGVAEVVRISEPYRLVSRRFHGANTVVEGEFGRIGGGTLWVALEPEGLPPGLDPPKASYALLAGQPFDAAVSRESEPVPALGALASMSIHPKPTSARWPVVFVTRKPSWNLDAWLAVAERHLARGGTQPVLLEAGGEDGTGHRSLDVMGLARVRARSHLPLVVDVPLIAQQRRHCEAVATAAVGAGADGVILRVRAGQDRRFARPATLEWDDALHLTARLRAVREAMQS